MQDISMRYLRRYRCNISCDISYKDIFGRYLTKISSKISYEDILARYLVRYLANIYSKISDKDIV